MLEHVLSKVEISVGTRIYILPSNLNLKIGSTKGYNKILISSTKMKIIEINKNIETSKNKLPEPVRVAGNVAHDAPMKKTDNQSVMEDHLMDKSRMLTEQHNDEKLSITLLIVGAGLIAYQFW